MIHKLNDAVTKGSPPPDKPSGYLLIGHSTTSTTTISPTKSRLRVVAPWVPFPVEALPEPLRSFVIEGAKALGCVPAFLALFILAIVAAMIGNSRRARLKRGWTEPAIIWSLVAADSGSLKSPAQELAAKVTVKLQSRFFEEYKAALVEYQDAMVRYERAFADWRKTGGPNLPVKPVEPVCRRLMVSDITIEKLAAVLSENKRGFLALRDELAGWFASFTRYNKDGGDKERWLEIHRGGLLTVDSKSGGTIYVPRANVSVTGGIQPAILARVLTKDHRDSGLAARLLIAMPPRAAKVWTEAELSEETEEDFARLIERLIALESRIDSDGQESPVLLDLSPEAKEVWVQYYNRWGNEQASTEGDLANAFAKIEAYAIRLALIHHVVDKVHRNEDDVASIGAESVKAGIQLADWFAYEARRVYAILDETEEEKSLRRLLDLIIRKGGTVTPRDLQRSNDTLYPTTEVAQAALLELANAGLGVISIETPTNGGHPSVRFTLSDTRHPTVGSSSLPSDAIVPPDTRSSEIENPPENESSVEEDDENDGREVVDL